MCFRAMSTEIDLKKMPLGNLKKTQIQSGYEVLTSIQAVLEEEDDEADARREQQLTDLSNHFYTVIPHDFGLGARHHCLRGLVNVIVCV